MARDLYWMEKLADAAVAGEFSRVKKLLKPEWRRRCIYWGQPLSWSSLNESFMIHLAQSSVSDKPEVSSKAVEILRYFMPLWVDSGKKDFSSFYNSRLYTSPLSPLGYSDKPEAFDLAVELSSYGVRSMFYETMDEEFLAGKKGAAFAKMVFHGFGKGLLKALETGEDVFVEVALPWLDNAVATKTIQESEQYRLVSIFARKGKFDLAKRLGSPCGEDMAAGLRMHAASHKTLDGVPEWVFSDLSSSPSIDAMYQNLVFDNTLAQKEKPSVYAKIFGSRECITDSNFLCVMNESFDASIMFVAKLSEGSLDRTVFLSNVSQKVLSGKESWETFSSLNDLLAEKGCFHQRASFLSWGNLFNSLLSKGLSEDVRKLVSVSIGGALKEEFDFNELSPFLSAGSSSFPALKNPNLRSFFETELMAQQMRMNVGKPRPQIRTL